MYRKLALALLVALAGLIIVINAIDDTSPPLSAQNGGSDNEDKPATLSVTGTGKVTATPDIGLVQVGVITQAREASGALSANSVQMENLFAVLTARGVEQRDIQTTNLSISPVFSRPDETRNQVINQAPRIVAYRVENRLKVKVRDLDNFGTVLDELVTGGANTIHNIRFAIDDPQSLLDEALTKAMADARRKADILAAAGNFQVGRLTEVRDNAAFPIPRQARALTLSAAGPSVPIAEGELTFISSVSVGYEIAQ
ncbi:MAG: SIMPL domain-containing protein [Alphaproteobacteria bacterium]|nr:SIMPL domain-containing protein [Alphaproteobacteria bacterium]